MPAAHDDQPGIWTTTVTFNQLTDYLIYLKTHKDVDLDLVIMHGKTRIGLAKSDKPGAEALAITNSQRRDVTIGVINYRRQPIKFGISLNRIEW